jgi:hypothetical protein
MEKGGETFFNVSFLRCVTIANCNGAASSVTKFVAISANLNLKIIQDRETEILITCDKS